MGVLRSKITEKFGSNEPWIYIVATIVYIIVIIGGLLIIHYSDMGKRTYVITEKETGWNKSFSTEYLASFVGIVVITVGFFDLMDISAP